MTRLDLVVGPNGAGKTTFVRLLLSSRRPGVPFVNADVIAAERWPQDQVGHAYEAAEVAHRARAALLESRRPFIAETVFSHPSKLELIRAAQVIGYEVRLHVLMVPVELAVARVRYRVASGGHDVPERKVRGRYERLWALVAEAAALVPAARFWANDARDGPRLVARTIDGVLQDDAAWPAWVHPDLLGRLGGDRAP